MNGILRFFAMVSVWVLGTTLSRAVEITEGPSAEVSSAQVVIRWSTDVAAGGRVQYGATVGRMDQRARADAVATRHEVRLQGLNPGMTYWYAVGTARGPLATNRFTTAGTTLGRSEPKVGSQSERDGRGGDVSAPSTVAKGSASAGGFDGAKLQVPPTRQIWGVWRTLQDHFDRHGADFAAKNPDDYAAQAWIFLRRAKAERLPAKVDDDGVLRVYEPKTRTFAAYNRDLTVRTFFKPGRRDYFADQPGRPVDLNTLVK